MHSALPLVRKEYMMLKLKSVRCLLAGLLISCAATGCATTTAPVQPDFCATAKAIYVGKDDVITDATAREILEHNLTGQKLCGWGKKTK